MNKKQIPVLLLTGYLGSGKTTLLNRILANEKGIKFAVIVNDIGEVNIDASLIESGGIVGQGDDSLVALQNGCICCTLKMDLVKQLSDIANMERFDYIVIEASGICEPAPIAQTICAYPQMYPEYAEDAVANLDAIVTVVDAKRMKDEFANGNDLKKQNIGEDELDNLGIQQIEFCNIILRNKADELTREEMMELKGIIKSIQPHAEIFECNYGDVDLNKIINTHLFDFNKVATSAAWISAIEEDDDLENEESGEALEYGIETFVYYRRKPFDINFFDDFISRKWPKQVIRCKGICWFKEEPDICYVCEQAGKQVGLRNAGQWYATMPADELKAMMDKEPALRRDWDQKYGDRMEKLVFIGQHLDKEAITKSLDQCLTD